MKDVKEIVIGFVLLLGLVTLGMFVISCLAGGCGWSPIQDIKDDCVEAANEASAVASANCEATIDDALAAAREWANEEVIRAMVSLGCSRPELQPGEPARDPYADWTCPANSPLCDSAKACPELSPPVDAGVP